MKLRYPEVPERPVNLAELRKRCDLVLNRNRNQRQALELLMHDALILRKAALAARTHNIQARLAWQAESLRRISRSFSGNPVPLSTSTGLLVEWRSLEIFLKKDTLEQNKSRLPGS